MTVTDDELQSLEALADARTVDADVRAGLHALAAAYRQLRREAVDADDLRRLAREYKQRAEGAEAREEYADREKQDAEEEAGRAKAQAEELFDAARDFVRERQDAAVLGEWRCRTGRAFDKLEQLV